MGRWVKMKLEYNVLQLGDVAKKHTQIIELRPVRKAQNQLQIKPNLAILPSCCYVRLWLLNENRVMKILNENGGIFFKDNEYYFEKTDLLNLFRLQKALLEEENIIANLLECANIWQRYSSDLYASWLFFPDNDDDILRQISSSDFFTSYQDYSGEEIKTCVHPKSEREYIGNNLLRCKSCGKEFS